MMVCKNVDMTIYGIIMFYLVYFYFLFFIFNNKSLCQYLYLILLVFCGDENKQFTSVI